MTPRVMAVCGKGGVGKTTVAAIMAAELLRRKNIKALIIDADHAGGLEMALDFQGGKSINQVRVETINQIKKKNTDNKELTLSFSALPSLLPPFFLRFTLVIFNSFM